MRTRVRRSLRPPWLRDRANQEVERTWNRLASPSPREEASMLMRRSFTRRSSVQGPWTFDDSSTNRWRSATVPEPFAIRSHASVRGPVSGEAKSSGARASFRGSSSRKEAVELPVEDRDRPAVELT